MYLRVWIETTALCQLLPHLCTGNRRKSSYHGHFIEYVSIHSGTCAAWKPLSVGLYFSCAWLVLLYHREKSFCSHTGGRTVALPGQWILLKSTNSWTIFSRYDVQNTICPLCITTNNIINKQKWKTQKPTKQPWIEYLMDSRRNSWQLSGIQKAGELIMNRHLHIRH